MSHLVYQGIRMGAGAASGLLVPVISGILGEATTECFGTISSTRAVWIGSSTFGTLSFLRLIASQPPAFTLPATLCATFAAIVTSVIADQETFSRTDLFSISLATVAAGLCSPFSPLASVVAGVAAAYLLSGGFLSSPKSAHGRKPRRA